MNKITEHLSTLFMGVIVFGLVISIGTETSYDKAEAKTQEKVLAQLLILNENLEVLIGLHYAVIDVYEKGE